MTTCCMQWSGFAVVCAVRHVVVYVCAMGQFCCCVWRLSTLYKKPRGIRNRDVQETPQYEIPCCTCNRTVLQEATLYKIPRCARKPAVQETVLYKKLLCCKRNHTVQETVRYEERHGTRNRTVQEATLQKMPQ